VGGGLNGLLARRTVENAGLATDRGREGREWPASNERSNSSEWKSGWVSSPRREKLESRRDRSLSDACERLLCKAGLGLLLLGKCGEGEVARLERVGLCREEEELPMEEMEPRLEPCKEVAGEGGGVVKL